MTQAKELLIEACNRKHYTQGDLFKQVRGISFKTFKKRLEDPMTLTLWDALQISIALDLTDEEVGILYGRKAHEENIKKLYK